MRRMGEQYQIRKNVDVCTDDFWYDLTDGGYLKPYLLLMNAADVEEVEKAIVIVRKFERSLEDQVPNFLR